LSPLEKRGNPLASPRVTLLFEGRQTVGTHSNKGDNCILSTHLYSMMSVKIMLVRKMVLYNVFWKKKGISKYL
jgi:hypothetical protein